MRILKTAENVIRIMCGEMLNIENSTLHYINGEKTYSGHAIPQAAKGYPKIVGDMVTDYVRASSGIIFTAPHLDINVFEAKIVEYIQKMECEIEDNLQNYHTVSAQQTTNLLLKSSLKITHDSTQKYKLYARNSSVNKSIGNTRRQFARDNDFSFRCGRFTWVIKPINIFNNCITSHNMSDAISNYISSIFYDSDDICVLEHGEITFDFSTKLLRGFARMTDDSIKISEHIHPLLIDLSTFWRSRRHIFRDIDARSILAIKYEELKEFMPNNTISNNCDNCRTFLWGENYAVLHPTHAETFLILCPLCIHNSRSVTYDQIYMVNIPQNFEQVLNMDVGRKELRLEVLKGIKMVCEKIGDRLIEYKLIGDKYMHFDDVDDFLYTPLSRIGCRKICKLL